MTKAGDGYESGGVGVILHYADLYDTIVYCIYFAGLLFVCVSPTGPVCMDSVLDFLLHVSSSVCLFVCLHTWGVYNVSMYCKIYTRMASS